MSTVVADMSMSLDGFVADPHDGVDRIFTWYGKAQPPRPATGGDERDTSDLGVIVYGRRTFEVANGWGGTHPLGVPVIVVTHSIPEGWPRPDSTVSFVTDGIERAIAQAKVTADGKTVALGSPSITQQCLDLGMVDRIQVSLVPLLLGHGIRFFENLSTAPVELEGPSVVEGNGVTHLAYRVAR
ncbi:MAG: dihydrofolate reductase family protein [Solirubrobacteraceae bacterium]